MGCQGLLQGSFEPSILRLLHGRADSLPTSHLGSSEPHFTTGLNRGGLEQWAVRARPEDMMFSALNCSQDCPPGPGGYILGQRLLPPQSVPLRDCYSGQDTHHVGWSCSLKEVQHLWVPLSKHQSCPIRKEPELHLHVFLNDPMVMVLPPPWENHGGGEPGIHGGAAEPNCLHWAHKARVFWAKPSSELAHLPCHLSKCWDGDEALSSPALTTALLRTMELVQRQRGRKRKGSQGGSRSWESQPVACIL